MRTYYFCTDTAKEMESWMKVMTDAALVHTEPVRRLVLTTGICLTDKMCADVRYTPTVQGHSSTTWSVVLYPTHHRGLIYGVFYGLKV